MRNKQVVLLIAGISGIVTGIIVSLNIPFIRQGLFYPASPVEIVVSLSLTFSVSVVFFVGAIVGWISVSEIYYSRMTGWICPYISRHLLSLTPLQARCRRYSRGER